MKRLIAFLLFALPAAAANPYWVSPTGTSAWASCQSATPLSGTSACSLSTANTNAAAGNLVYLRAGTYSGVTIAPANSGTGTPPTGPWNFITFMAYTGETPTISQTGTADVMTLTGKSYIRVSGITFTWGGNGAVRIQTGANHNELDDNTFNSPSGWPEDFLLNTNNNAGQWSTHNWIHNNTFSVSGSAHGTEGSGCTDGGGDNIDIGVGGGTWSQTTDLDNNNSIENNIFAHNPHAAHDGYGEYNVFRGNVYHNEPWSSGCSVTTNYVPTYTNAAYNGDYSHRDAQFTEDYQRVGTYNLFEGNRWGYAGINQDNAGSEDMDLAAPQNIMRFNFFYASMGTCLQFKYGWGGSVGGGGNGGTYNRVYNNTFYDCGVGWPAAIEANGDGCNTSSCPLAATAIMAYSGSSSALGNVLKNNLIWDPDSLGYSEYVGDVLNQSVGGTSPPFSPSSAWGEMSSAVHNWCTGTTGLNSSTYCSASGNPQFNDPDITNVNSTTLPDLTLKSSSSAINGGTYLTTTTNSGSGATVVNLADAEYFQDGSWGSDLARSEAGLGGTLQPDAICIGTVTNCATISIGGVNHTPATSATSNTVGTGSQTFTVPSGISAWSSCTSPCPISIQSPSSAGVLELGTITSYSGTSLVVNVATVVSGSGTYTSWVISTEQATLQSSLTWSSGADVWLYSNSSGTVVLKGSAPNYGAGMAVAASGSIPGGGASGASLSGAYLH